LSLSAKEERDLVAKLEDMFQSALEHPSWQEWRSKIAPTASLPKAQWTAAERATLKKRHQPEITNNQVSVTIDRLVGQFVKQKVRSASRGATPRQTNSARRRSNEDALDVFPDPLPRRYDWNLDAKFVCR
jgi:hypothetical protein